MDKISKVPIKDRLSFLFVEKCNIDVKNGAFVLLTKDGIKTTIPIATVTAILLEPGTRISHAAVTLASKVGCMLIWTGEHGVRIYAAGQPGGARSDKLIHQAKLLLDDKLRTKVVRKMFTLRFKEDPPQNRSIEQLRGIEGVRVRNTYKELADKYNVAWYGRCYDTNNWNSGDIPNRCLSSATACLYGITEAAIVIAGYSPALGFLHSGKPKSFVYDVADIIKFDTVIPLSFEIASSNLTQSPERIIRLRCRDYFKSSKLLDRLVPLIEDVLDV